MTEYEFAEIFSGVNAILLLENFKFLETNKKNKRRKKYNHFRRAFERHIKEGEEVLALAKLDSYYNPTKIYKNYSSKRPAHFPKKKTDDESMLY